MIGSKCDLMDFGTGFDTQGNTGLIESTAGKIPGTIAVGFHIPKHQQQIFDGGETSFIDDGRCHAPAASFCGANLFDTNQVSIAAIDLEDFTAGTEKLSGRSLPTT